MIIALAWRPNFMSTYCVYIGSRYYCLKCESTGRRFQLREGHSRGLLRDYEPSYGPLFEATHCSSSLLTSTPGNISTFRLFFQCSLIKTNLRV